MSKMIAGLIALGLLAILLIQWLGWSATGQVPELGPTPAETSPPPATDAQGSKLLAKLDSVEPKESYASIVEHPLFRPDRKPEPPEEEAPEPVATENASQELDAVDLTAVLISPTIVSAWVKEPSSPKLQRLRIGDDFMGWSVQEIRDDRVVLERQGEQDTLILRDYSKAPPAAPPSAARTPTRRRPPRPPMPAHPPKK